MITCRVLDRVERARRRADLVLAHAGQDDVTVLATIFFSLLDHGPGSPTAMVRTVLIAAGLLAVAFVLSFLLPRDARMEEF
jgi:hypothetical protein